jgi:hypothetical protein
MINNYVALKSYTFNYRKKIFGFPIGKLKTYTEFLSIGIKSDDDIKQQRYYAVNSQFDFALAWEDREFRNDVLLPLWEHLRSDLNKHHEKYCITYNLGIEESIEHINYFKYTTLWSLSGLENLIFLCGKSKGMIVSEVADFCKPKDPYKYVYLNHMVANEELHELCEFFKLVRMVSIIVPKLIRCKFVDIDNVLISKEIPELRYKTSIDQAVYMEYMKSVLQNQNQH